MIWCCHIREDVKYYLACFVRNPPDECPPNSAKRFLLGPKTLFLALCFLLNLISCRNTIFQPFKSKNVPKSKWRTILRFQFRQIFRQKFSAEAWGYSLGRKNPPNNIWKAPYVLHEKSDNEGNTDNSEDGNLYDPNYISENMVGLLHLVFV